jgi:L,D-peptidoglycan transpeptidase YkuD (ErfK/YbiS/YcfS/YnhG family)
VYRFRIRHWQTDPVKGTKMEMTYVGGMAGWIHKGEPSRYVGGMAGWVSCQAAASAAPEPRAASAAPEPSYALAG